MAGKVDDKLEDIKEKIQLWAGRVECTKRELL